MEWRGHPSPTRNLGTHGKDSKVKIENRTETGSEKDASVTLSRRHLDDLEILSQEAEIERLEQEMKAAGLAGDYEEALLKKKQLEKLQRQISMHSKRTEDLVQFREEQIGAVGNVKQADNPIQMKREGGLSQDNFTSHDVLLERSSSAMSSQSHYMQRFGSDFSIHSSASSVMSDCLTVFLSSPLVWIGDNFQKHPLSMLDFASEKSLLEQALRDAQEIGAEINVVYEPATTDRLSAFLATDTSPVLHFSGHGSEEYLAIEHEGTMQPLTTEKLQEFISAGAGNVQLAFVSACHSQVAGNAFVEAGIPHVVCCRQDELLRDTAAIEFARTFYRALACRNTLLRAFRMAQKAVLVSAEVENAELEMNKFLLLPKEVPDDYHNVQIFFTRPARNRRALSYNAPNSILPKLPEVFVGRQELLYDMLQLVLKTTRWIQIAGPAGSGKFSVAASLCRYVDERIKSYFLDEVLWFSIPNRVHSDMELAMFFDQLFRCIQEEKLQRTEYTKCLKSIANILLRARVLIFVDAREVKDSTHLGRLNLIVQELLQSTQETKLIVIYPSGHDVSSGKLARKVTLSPLTLESSLELFGNWCDFVRHGAYPGINSSSDLVKLLASDKTQTPTTDGLSNEIFRRVGSGIPAKIMAMAKGMTLQEYKDLIRIGQRSDKQREQINSRAELEEKITTLTDQVEEAVQAQEFLKAQERQDMLHELELLRDFLPTLEELQSMQKTLQNQLKAAIRSKAFVKANELQKQLSKMEDKIRMEREVAGPLLLPTSTLKQTETDDHADSNEVLSEGTSQISSSAPIVEDHDVLKIILDPLRELDDDLISEQLKRFETGTREWAVRRFDDWMTNGDQRHRVFVLTAQAGVGKTGIVCRLARERQDVVAGYHFCRHDDSRRSNPKNMLLSLSYQIACRLPKYREALESIVREKMLSREELLKDYNVVALFELLLREPLSKLHLNKRHVILIDALDECQGKNEILLCIQCHFIKLPSWLKVFVTARPEYPIMHKLRKLSPTLIEPEEAENIHDMRIFFKRLLKDCSDDSFSDETVQMLVDKTGGLFIYASLLADMIRSNGRQQKLSHDVLGQFPEGLDDFYDIQFTRLLENDESLAWRVTKMIVAALEPLHMETIQSFTKCTTDERGVVARKLSEFFPIDKNRRINVYHKSLADWLTNPERRDSEFYLDLQEENKLLGMCCVDVMTTCGIISDVRWEGQINEAVAYSLRHGVSHLCSAGMMNEARKLLLNVQWLFVRTMEGDVYDIIADCQKFEKDRVVELVGRALGLALNSLRLDPKQLPSQLVGRLLGSSVGKPSDDKVARELSLLIESIKNFSFGFKWWCPVKPTWEQAEQPCLRTLVGHTSSIKSVACSKDFKTIISSSNDRTIRIWDAFTGHCEHVLHAHRGCVFCVDLLEKDDELKIVSGSGDRTVRIWDATFGECESVIQCGKQIQAVLWLADGQSIVSGAEDGKIRIWNAKSGECDSCLNGHNRVVVALALSPNKTKLASASYDKTCRIWDLETGACERVLAGPAKCRATSVAWSEGDDHSVFGVWDTAIGVWLPGNRTRTLEQATSQLVVSVSSDGSDLVSGTKYGPILLWDRDVGAPKGLFLGHTEGVYALIFAKDNTRIVSGSSDRTVRIFDATAVQGMEEMKFKYKDYRAWNDSESWIAGSKQHSARVNRVEWFHDGSKLATGGGDGTVRVWDPTTGRQIRLFHETAKSGVRTIAWSIDGGKIVSGLDNGNITIWNMDKDEPEITSEGHRNQVHGLKWSNSSKFILSGSRDLTVRVWEASTGRNILRVTGHTGGINSVGWSKDDSRIGSASTDQTARIWDATTGECLHVLEGHSGFVYSVRWSQDGKNVITRSSDQTVRIWDPNTGACKEIAKNNSWSRRAEECDRFYPVEGMACGVRSDYSVNFFKEM